jgi:ribosomal protein S27AE
MIYECDNNRPPFIKVSRHTLIEGIAMKKCPNCYAIMREMEKPNQIPGSPLHSEVHPSDDVARLRYECSQCGHFEDSFAPLSRTPVYR